jgi:hypothetical protein
MKKILLVFLLIIGSNLVFGIDYMVEREDRYFTVHRANVKYNGKKRDLLFVTGIYNLYIFFELFHVQPAASETYWNSDSYWNDADVGVVGDYADFVGELPWEISCGYLEKNYLYIFSPTTHSIRRLKIEIVE